MDVDKLKVILGLVREHELSELEIEQDGLRLRVRAGGGPPVHPPAVAPAPVRSGVDAGAGPAAVAPEAAGRPTAAGDGEVELAIVKSPIVGTFYRSAEPAAPAFAEVGARVRKGQVLCIIEAMKLMNEIESEYEGEVVAVYVDNGQAVQYGERLFAIRTS